VNRSASVGSLKATSPGDDGVSEFVPGSQPNRQADVAAMHVSTKNQKRNDCSGWRGSWRYMVVRP
jgi:hypothetical protein